MTGAELIVSLLSEVGVRICITNPGTTELPIVEALGKQRSLRSVLALQEGVATGAADGVFRVAEQLCCVLLHLGPGLMNGASFLHDARRSRTPTLVLVGQHVRSHLVFDPPLASDISSVAASVAVYYSEIDSCETIADELLSAVTAAFDLRGPAVVAIPHDVQTALVDENLLKHKETFSIPLSASPMRTSAIDQVISRIQRGEEVTFFVGGLSLDDDIIFGLRQIQKVYDIEVLFETFPSVMRRGRELPDFDKLPYFPDAAQRVLPKRGVFVLFGALNPISFFAFEDGRSELLSSEVERVELVSPVETGDRTLDLLLLGLDIEIDQGEPLESRDEFSLSVGGLISKAVRRGDIVVDEGRTGVPDLFSELSKAEIHTYLGHNGGAIGEGMPLGLGAALASPNSVVWVVQADGGAMYAPQALWTMSRERAEVKVVLISNRAYRILEFEMQRAGMEVTGDVYKLTSLKDPEIDWCKLASSMGVASCSCYSLDDLEKALVAARETKGPFLIEMVV